MQLQGAPLKVEGVTPLGIVDLEMARTVQQATIIYNAWQPDLVLIAKRNTFIDFLFLISYATCLCTACILISRNFKGLVRRTGVTISILVIVAAAFDALENVLMITTLSAHFKKEIVASTFIFASIKLMLVGVALLYIVLSLLSQLLLQKKKLVRIQN